jgi:hypothetical protein
MRREKRGFANIGVESLLGLVVCLLGFGALFWFRQHEQSIIWHNPVHFLLMLDEKGT